MNMSSFRKAFAFFYVIFSILTTSAQKDPGLAVIVNEAAQNPYITEYGHPDISAHRSGAGIAPQNTLMAFEVCVDAEDFVIDFFEFDVQITKDGELVLLHDQTYDNTSNAVEYFGKSDVNPKDYTYEELHNNLNLGAKFKKGETDYADLRGEDIPYNLRVLRCEEILDFTEQHADPEKPYRYMIEIKSRFSSGKRAVDKLYSVLKERNLLDKTIVSTYWPDIHSYIDKNYPDITRTSGLIEMAEFYYYCKKGLDLNQAKIQYDVLQLPYGKNVMPWGKEIINLGTSEIINYAHKYDLAVQYWTVNDAENMIYLRDNGADAIMTDWPALACEVLAGTPD
ncbi:MAG: hypothetical protein LBS36_10890 [Oscillospiraceae bacterium]|jgi:glycerophosphoryl diester phosphodiesterase|nr:hypothetical protein [Oscillospiraceae bacterium]